MEENERLIVTRRQFEMGYFAWDGHEITQHRYLWGVPLDPWDDESPLVVFNPACGGPSLPDVEASC